MSSCKWLDNSRIDCRHDDATSVVMIITSERGLRVGTSGWLLLQYKFIDQLCPDCYNPTIRL